MTQGLIGLYLFVNLVVFGILPKDHPIKHLFGKIPRKFAEVLYVCSGSARKLWYFENPPGNLEDSAKQVWPCEMISHMEGIQNGCFQK